MMNGRVASDRVAGRALDQWQEAGVLAVDRAEAIEAFRRGLQDSAAGRVSTVDDAFAQILAGRSKRKPA